VHLLSHGIWAFKVVGPGAATDLVYGDPLPERAPLAKRIARALVLTEWKLVRKESELDEKAREGRRQAEIYAAGVLGDLELKRTRYIVLVSESELRPPDDFPEKGIIYRHVIIPVKPKSPSLAARQRLGK
jgi:hypothetical protein